MRIAWEGPQGSTHSFALSNGALCARLAARGHELEILTPVQAGSGAADVHVRHQWPPDFTPPASGRWVMFQPWEFGSIPSAWVGPMSTVVDEVWAYTTYVRDCYVAAGIPSERVRVAPLGVDPDVFRPTAAAAPLATAKRFKFLFVGGTIHRKGFDALLTAYASEFTAGDDVCLVVQEMGASTFYRGQTAGAAIERLRANPAAPEILYLERALGWRELAGLYRACDCLAHPYRGEGFGLPIAEAMACGTPAVVTAYGAALDFCSAEDSYLVLARAGRFSEKRVGSIETVDHPWLGEPDPLCLRAALRRAFADRDEWERKGRAASRRIRGEFTWSRAADAIEARLEALMQSPPRRSGA